MKLRTYQIWWCVAFCLGAIPVLAQNSPAATLTTKTTPFPTAVSSTPIFIQSGLRAEQVLAAKGQPCYQTEHYTLHLGEQVWLYTKAQTQKTVAESEILDVATKWPMLYRRTTVRNCQVGDIFVRMSRGIVRDVVPANTNMAYGPCVIETTEEFLPIVANKSESVTRTAKNTVPVVSVK